MKLLTPTYCQKNVLICRHKYGFLPNGLPKCCLYIVPETYCIRFKKCKFRRKHSNPIAPTAGFTLAPFLTLLFILYLKGDVQRIIIGVKTRLNDPYCWTGSPAVFLYWILKGHSVTRGAKNHFPRLIWLFFSQCVMLGALFNSTVHFTLCDPYIDFSTFCHL